MFCKIKFKTDFVQNFSVQDESLNELFFVGVVFKSHRAEDADLKCPKERYIRSQKHYRHMFLSL